jgi:hypothetical protein
MLALGSAQAPNTLADCRAIIEGAKEARRALVIGASFIGLLRPNEEAAN